MSVQKTADTLSERPIYHRLGLFLVKQKPLTLAQMWEIGALVDNMEDLELAEKFNAVAMTMQRYKDIDMCQKIIIVMLFRKRWKRVAFGWLVRKHLNMALYEKVMLYGVQSFHASFFLTSLTFLKGIKTMTSPTNTGSQTVPGASWEAL